ncbi:sensor domain-containing phosphodiesterase [Gayadomonas joobiniege]|uniref:bifunctional diguanylate cyclase/phosphodiesterase n=1 Tax=Gayadomonas joobiniege TaxID=1234606 RepID=UPI00037D8334|nr:sensor domain-containing phosphodiesterase [Gayadomonas joobiniege]
MAASHALSLWYSKILDAQREVLEMIASGIDLDKVLQHICQLLDSLLVEEAAISSVVLTDGQRIINSYSAALPKDYSASLIGIPIGEKVGSCGTAMFLKFPVLVSDITTDPRWAIAKPLAEPYGLRSCWSIPILNSLNEIMGSFAVYHSTSVTPSADKYSLIQRFSSFCCIAICRWNDEKQQKNLIQAIQRSHSQLETYGKILPDAVLICDRHTVIYDAFGHIPLAVPESLIHTRLDSYVNEKTGRKIQFKIYEALSTKQITSLDYCYCYQNTKYYYEARIAPVSWSGDNQADKVMLLIRDTSARNQAEQKLKQRAYYDELTSLANRNLLKKRLAWVLKNLEFAEYSALLIINLNNFKRINDALGYVAGDEILKVVAKRFKQKTTEMSLLARFSGDEFAILIRRPFSSQINLLRTCRRKTIKLHKTLEDKIDLYPHQFKVSASIGICIFNNQLSLDEVLQQAHSAMFECKARTNSQYVIFNPALKNKLNRNLALESELLLALQNGQLAAHFQPQMSPAGLIIGAEALVRWHHPEKGKISPDEFLPFAEKMGFISSIDLKVFADACLLFKTAQELDIQPKQFSLSVNLSAYDFTDKKLIDNLVSLLHSHQLEANNFTLELTESVLASNLVQTIEQFRRLAVKGFKLSIDDFGTGYSSLNYLEKLPVDEIKIDRHFVERMALSERGEKIVNTIIDLGKSLGLHIVAEGIETRQQQELLAQKQVTAMQGYLLCPPVDAGTFIKMLTDQAKK